MGEYKDLEQYCYENGYECGCDCDIASYCCWGATVWMTKEPNTHGRPDRGFMTHSTGGSTAEAAMNRAAEEMLKWIEEMG